MDFNHSEIILQNNCFDKSNELVLNNDNINNNNNNTNEIHSSQINLNECNEDTISDKTNSLELNDGSRISDRYHRRGALLHRQ